eukprot:1249926-Rhodomonas_salina.3
MRVLVFDFGVYHHADHGRTGKSHPNWNSAQNLKPLSSASVSEPEPEPAQHTLQPEPEPAHLTEPSWQPAPGASASLKAQAPCQGLGEQLWPCGANRLFSTICTRNAVSCIRFLDGDSARADTRSLHRDPRPCPGDPHHDEHAPPRRRSITLPRLIHAAATVPVRGPRDAAEARGASS